VAQDPGWHSQAPALQKEAPLDSGQPKLELQDSPVVMESQVPSAFSTGTFCSAAGMQVPAPNPGLPAGMEHSVGEQWHAPLMQVSVAPLQELSWHVEPVARVVQSGS
jgi:hypothetical protein